MDRQPSRRPADLTVDRLERTRAIMDEHFPEAVVSGYEALIAELDLPDVRDCHVLAAAVHGCASAIVTFNLRDFPADRLTPHGLEAHIPMTSLAVFLNLSPKRFLLPSADSKSSVILRPGRDDPDGTRRTAAVRTNPLAAYTDQQN